MKDEIKRFVTNIVVDLVFAVVAAYFANLILTEMVPTILLGDTDPQAAQEAADVIGGMTGALVNVEVGTVARIVDILKRFTFKWCFVALYGVKFIVSYVTCLFNVRSWKENERVLPIIKEA